MIVFAHTKFGLVRIQRSGVKRGEESAHRSERVFQIPIQIGLRDKAKIAFLFEIIELSYQVFLGLKYQNLQKIVPLYEN